MLGIHSTFSRFEPYRIPVRLALCYVLIFTLLDWLSYIRPLQGLNITPWSPQPALAIAMLLWGHQWLWLVWVGLLVADLVVRGVPADWFFVLISSTSLSLVYASIAQALRARINLKLTFTTQKEFLYFTAVVVCGALLSSLVYIAAYLMGGLALDSSVYEAVARYWVGDAVGLIVLLPLLLAWIDPQRRHALRDVLTKRSWWMIVAFTFFLLWIVFDLGGNNHFRYFYLLFLPVIWLSAEIGFNGAILSSVLVQIGLILAIQIVPNEDLAVFELQLLMAAITMTGLLLGVTVDERTRAESQLRSSLRLAAAGQMAASLAHELSQPLTALNNYAQACQMLVNGTGELESTHQQELLVVTQRMIDDARRAGLVVKSLRDFFRTGASHLQRLAPGPIVLEAMQNSQRRAQTIQIRLETCMAEELPSVWMDPVQISIVLRNLITNAIDSASADAIGGAVSVIASQFDGYLQIEVQDSGPGIVQSRMQGLFEAGPSDKPGGMGIGLSICRAIVEAHGGKLWAEVAEHGCFRFTLPCDTELPSERLHA